MSVDIESLQGDFIEAFFGDENSAAVSHVIGDDKLSAAQRVGIYKGSVHGILTQALGTTFPVCKALVGDDFFDNMCDLFINTYPPKTTYFAEYGADFSLFLASFEHVNDIPYIVDTASLEWARQKIWHTTPATTPADFSGLAKLNDNQQARAVFQLANNMHLIQSNYRIDEIWFAHQNDVDTSSEVFENIEVKRSVKLILRKSQNAINISVMNETEDDSYFWDFLQAISSEKNISELADQFGEALPLYLNQGIEGAWIQSFYIKQ